MFMEILYLIKLRYDSSEIILFSHYCLMYIPYDVSENRNSLFLKDIKETLKVHSPIQIVCCGMAYSSRWKEPC